MSSIAIIGSGAAGLATAIFAAERVPGTRIALLDGARSLGAKILVSGGGRCNITNATVSEADFSGGSPAAIRRTLRALPVPETIAWFASMGIPVHEEARGKLFPDSNRARDVLDALVGEARSRGVALLAGHRVERVAPSPDGFTLVTSTGVLEARLLVLATGGLSLPSTGSDGAGYDIARALGHSIVPTTPALVPLVLDGDEHRALQGVAHDVRLTLVEARHRPRRFDGPMLWTHFGVSGPAVLDLSRHWLRARLAGHAAEVSASLSPFASFADADGWLQQQASARPRAQVATALGAVLPQSLADFVARSDDTSSPAATPRPPERDGFSGPAGSSAVSPAPALPDASAPMAELTRERRRQLAHKLAAWRMPFLDSRGYTHAEVTAGGVALSEIDPASMRSRICPGLFVVGEVLDVDGRLGGFNFQWAWASARAAADGLASALA